MQTIAFVGLNLAKNVLQVHGIASDGAVVVRRQLRQGQLLAFFQLIMPPPSWDRRLRLRPSLGSRIDGAGP